MPGLSGCLFSFQPFYTKYDVVYNTNLPGLYLDKRDPSDTLIIENLSNTSVHLSPAIEAIKSKGYLMTFKNRSDQTDRAYAAFIVLQNNSHYIDLFPMSNSLPWEKLLKGLTIPLHSIYKLEYNSKELLKLMPPDQEYVYDLIRNKRVNIKHEILYSEPDINMMILMAGTKELQNLLFKYGNEEDAYDLKEMDEFIKVK